MSSQQQLIKAFENIQERFPWAVVVQEFAAKSDILLEDDEDNDVLLIRSGKAAVLLPGGSEILLGAGDLIGELSFLLDNKRTASIVAREPVVCWVINTDNIDKVFVEAPEVSAQFYKSLGKVIAERLVSGSKRNMQNIIFQTEKDPLIGVMTGRFQEVRSHFDNLIRILRKELNVSIQFHSERLESIYREYQGINDSSSWDIRRQKIDIVTNEFSRDQKELLKKYTPKMQSVFLGIQQMLVELLDLEKRTEVGKIGLNIFSDSIVSEVPLWKKRLNSGTSDVEPLLLIAHILQETTEDAAIWDVGQLMSEWLDSIFQSMQTIQAFKSRINLLSEVSSKQLSERPKITIINDAAGVILAKIYPKVAEVGGGIYAVSHDATSLYYMDLGMDIRSGRVKMRFHRISSILTLILGDADILPPNVALKSQDRIIVDGLADYLPDRYFVRLVEKCLPYLTENGSIYVSALLPTSDQVLFSSFFQWHVIRRTEKELQAIFDSLNLQVVSFEKDGAIVVQIQKGR